MLSGSIKYILACLVLRFETKIYCSDPYIPLLIYCITQLYSRAEHELYFDIAMYSILTTKYNTTIFSVLIVWAHVLPNINPEPLEHMNKLNLLNGDSYHFFPFVVLSSTFFWLELSQVQYHHLTADKNIYFCVCMSFLLT